MSSINICVSCDSEILSELTDIIGLDLLLEEAASNEEGWMSATAGTAYITLSCRCGSAEVQFGPGTVPSSWDLPDGWLVEDGRAFIEVANRGREDDR